MNGVGVEGIENLRVRGRHLILGWIGQGIFCGIYIARQKAIGSYVVIALFLSWGSVTCMVSSENRRASDKYVFLISFRIIRIISRPVASSQPRFRQTRMILSIQMKLLSSNSVTWPFQSNISISVSPFMVKFYDIIELYNLVLRGRLTTVERAIRNDILRGKNIDVYRVISYAVCTIDTEEDV